MRYDISVLYFFIDNFCKVYEGWESARMIPHPGKRKRGCNMALSELLTIMIGYHLSGYKCFKYYYLYEIGIKHRDKFPKLLSYNRYVQLMPRLFLPLYVLLHSLRGKETGLYFMDSTHLAICHNKRISRNKVFAEIAERGKTTMGWFFGFKLHLVINNQGQIMALKITKGNVDDRVPVTGMTKDLKGIVAADKGYLSKKLFAELYAKGLKLITGIRKDMKNYLMPLQEKIFLRKRFLVETVFDKLKSYLNINHTRHRSTANALINWLSALTAYQSLTNKPALKAFSLIQN